MRAIVTCTRKRISNATHFFRKAMHLEELARAQREEANQNDSEELFRLRSEYTKWCNRMDCFGSWGGMYDCHLNSHLFLNKAYYYFVFVCSIYCTIGWSVALYYSLFQDAALPCFLTTYEIHSDNKKKDTWEAISVILLTLIPVINFIFRPKWFSSNYTTKEFATSGFCPLAHTHTLKKLVVAVKLNCILAHLIPVLGFIFGFLIWNLNLSKIVETEGKFSCGNTFLIILDQAIIFPIYFISQIVVGHTSMSFALKMEYFKEALSIMMDFVQNAPIDENLALEVVDRFNELQRRINMTGKKFGMYMGIYGLFCVLCSSFFVGKIAEMTKQENPNYFDFLLRLFYQCLFILPNIYVLVKVASLGTTGMRLMRTYLRTPLHESNRHDLAKATYVINYFNLRLNVADVGLRVYGVPLTFKTLTQIFSLWGTFLSMIYSTASKS
eukprot:g4757.t1